jgi:hypothetical protein
MHPAPVTGAVQDAEMLEAEAIGKFVALLSGYTLLFGTRLVAGEGVPDCRCFLATEETARLPTACHVRRIAH